MNDSIDNRIRGIKPKSSLEPWEIIAAHRYRPQDPGTIDGIIYCTCGWNVPSVSRNSGTWLHGTHVADELKDAGWLMVETGTLRKLFGHSHNDYSFALRELRIKLHEATS